MGAMLMNGCNGKSSFSEGQYGYDVTFFEENNIGIVELESADKDARILIVPGYQGRVMTSTAAGNEGDSYGWINHKLIKSGVIDPQFNAFGGEERFWLGPEGGPFSLYFKPGAEQVFKNWDVPAVLDTEAFDIVSQSKSEVSFVKQTSLVNASGTTFDMEINRTISLLDKSAVLSVFGIDIPESAHMVAYSTDNRIRNNGTEEWTKENGLISVWLLCMFNPEPTTTVFIPYHKDHEGIIVNDDYFGKVPSDRLKVKDGMIYFKIDGNYRSKIGLPAGSAAGWCGSYDSRKHLLTLLRYTNPEGNVSYVNSKWGDQDDAFNGDVINAYNDGVTEEGTLMGPFYEIETSSPGAELEPGESLQHVQHVLHLQADEEIIASIVKKLFDVDLKVIYF